MMVSPSTYVDDFVSNFAKGIIQPDHGMQLYAIIDLTQPSTNDPAVALAGIIALQSTSVVHKRTEIGYVAILPECQRTHVTTNSVGLMLQHAFEKPDNGGIDGNAKGDLEGELRECGIPESSREIGLCEGRCFEVVCCI